MSWRYAFCGRAGPAVALLALLSAPPAFAMDCKHPVEPGERPRLEAFTESRDFLAAMMSWQERAARREAQQRACPGLADVPDGTLAGAGTRGAGTRDVESLDDAVARGRSLPPFDYARHPRWYNRTTSRTFGLPPLPAARMDDGLISTRWGDDVLEPGLQRALLAMRGPIDEVADGQNAANYHVRMLRDREFEQDRAAARAGDPLPFTTLIVYHDHGGTRLTFYYSGSRLVHTSGFIVGCMADQC